MTQYAFYFDGSRCTGCKTCEFACKDYYDLDTQIHYRRIYEVTGGQTALDANGYFTSDCFSYYVSLACNHCEQPSCVEVCPTGAMQKNDETGLVNVDPDLCIGCGYCNMACPYDAPKVDRDKGYSVKCTGCEQLVTAGTKPLCVRGCPARALDFGPVEEMAQYEGGEIANIAPLPSPSYTIPNFLIKPSDDALPAEAEQGKVANPLEVS